MSCVTWFPNLVFLSHQSQKIYSDLQSQLVEVKL